ncbi:hypothetical protein [Nocardia sp. NPDC049526]|uniref:hypothetical protein n=1 Tax=Nocardia sp. NPDC049526 TaxID=3364316 RepID=UPI00378C0010
MFFDIRNGGSDLTSREMTADALGFRRALFAAGLEALGSMMAGRAEEGVREPEMVSESVAFFRKIFWWHWTRMTQFVSSAPDAQVKP